MVITNLTSLILVRLVGGVFSTRNLGYAIVNDLLDFPEPQNVNDSDFTYSFIFVGDDVFPMKTNLVKPYSAFHLDFEKPITNYQIRKASRIIGSTFGIVEARIRVVVLFLLRWKRWHLLQRVMLHYITT